MFPIGVRDAEALTWGVAPFAERVRVMFPIGVRDAEDEEAMAIEG